MTDDAANLNRSRVQYARKLRDGAHQLNGIRTAVLWHDAGVPIEIAISFANKGFLPSEGESLISRVFSSGVSDADDVLDLIEVLTRSLRSLPRD